MKKHGILNDRLSGVIAEMGHTDMLVVADAGLPCPIDVERIDLAVTRDLPRFMDVVRAIAGELVVEKVVIASETELAQPGLVTELRQLFPHIAVESIPHVEFKLLSLDARAVVRTGECTPYANVILISGVNF